MREFQLVSFQCFQMELPGRTSNKRRGHIDNQPQATSSTCSLLKINGSRADIKSRISENASGHKCVAIDDTIKSKGSQQLLISSVLRRPHATSYSPLDYQTMPDVGKAPKQPYRSQSACTVYRYASRPLSAVQAGTSHGKHTKSSLLRKKAISCDSIASKTGSSFCTESSRLSTGNKRLCQIIHDYRIFKKGPAAKQIPLCGQTSHSFLTGARYNNSRCLDSRALSKLGVYIPKSDLQTFFVKDLPLGQHDGIEDDETIEYNLNMSEAQENIFSPSAEDLLAPETVEKAVNTESNFFSIQSWHSAEWHTNRKPTKEKASRTHTVPSRFKPVSTLYHDYDTV